MLRFLTFLILFTLGNSLFAQNFRLGFQASPHITWMNSGNGNIENSSVRLGVKYGLEADMFIAGFPRYSLNTGLFVANHTFGAKYNIDKPFFINDETMEGIVDLKFKLNYIEIPINIKLRSDQFYRMTFYGQFGLTNLFNISASAYSSGDQLNGDSVNEGLVNRSIQFYNLCMLMGGGVEYDIGGNTAINFGIQYINGLTDVTSIQSLSEKTIFNSLRLVVGVMF